MSIKLTSIKKHFIIQYREKLSIKRTKDKKDEIERGKR